MKRWTYLFCIFLLMIGTVSGCGKQPGSATKESSKEEFVAKEVDLGEEYSTVQAIRYISEEITMVAVSDADNTNVRIFQTEDGGKTWEKIVDVAKTLKIDKTDSVTVTIGAGGQIFYEVIKKSVSVASTEYYLTDEKLQPKLLNIQLDLYQAPEADDQSKQSAIRFQDSAENSLMTKSFTDDGNLLAVDMNGQGLLIDGSSGEIKQKFELVNEMGFISAIAEVDGKAYFYSGMSIEVFDIENGSKITDDEISKTISENSEKQSSGGTAFMMGSASLFKKDDKTLVFETSNGIYELNLSNQKTKEIATMKELNGGTDMLANITPLNAKTILVAKLNMENSKLVMLKKEKVDEKAEAAKKSLKIWSLRENHTVSMLADYYKKRHSDVNVSFEVGIETGSSTTVSDAISQLNTKMMAGDGPDIVLLDGLPIDSYMEKGMLADLTDTYKKIGTENLISSVTKAYEKDGKISAIPTSFASLQVTGSGDLANAAKNMQAFTKYAQNTTVDAAFKEANMTQFVEFFYYACVNNWLKDGKINQEELSNYFKNFKTLYDLKGEKVNSFTQADEASGMFITNHYFFMSDSPTGFMFDYIGMPSYQRASLNAIEKARPTYSDASFNTDAGKLYIPSSILSVNAKSQNVDLAKEFIYEYFTTDYSENASIVVSVDVLKNSPNLDKGIEEPMEVPGTPEAMIQPLTQEEQAAVIKSVEELNTPVNQDGIIMETVLEQLTNYVINGEDLATCVQNVQKKVDLYLSE